MNTTPTIASRFLTVALPVRRLGLLLLIPALIGRIPRKVPRRIVGWTTGVAAAAAVPFFCLIFLLAALGAFGLVTPLRLWPRMEPRCSCPRMASTAICRIYTQYNALHYKRVRDAPEISTWPRVKD
jgi:hypothetical protein